MGLFDALKKGYDNDDDLKDLEELMYDNDSEVKNKRSINDMIKSFELGNDTASKKSETSDYNAILGNVTDEKMSEDGPSGLAEKTKKQQADVQKEEEKYDNLLNSLQTQTLIQKVDNVSKVKDTNKKSERTNKVITKKTIKKVINRILPVTMKI